MPVHTDEDFEAITPFKDNKNDRVLSPISLIDIEILEYLYSKKIILINPGSKIKAFSFKKNKDIGTFTYVKTSWIVNISCDKKMRLSLCECYESLKKRLV